MKLSELINKCQRLLDTYGDRDILVDTEAMEYTCHVVEISDVTTVLTEECIADDPNIMNESPFDTIIIHLDNRVKQIPFRRYES